MTGFSMGDGPRNGSADLVELFDFYKGMAKQYGFQKPTNDMDTKRFKEFIKYVNQLVQGTFWEMNRCSSDWMLRNQVPEQYAEPMTVQEVRNRIKISCRRYRMAMTELDYQFPGYRPEKPLSLTEFIYSKHPEARSLMRYFFFQVPDKVDYSDVSGARKAYLETIERIVTPLPDRSGARNRAWEQFFEDTHWNRMSTRQKTRFWLNLNSLTRFYVEDGKDLWRKNRNNTSRVQSLASFLGLVRDVVKARSLTNIPFPSEDNGWWETFVHYCLQEYELALPLFPLQWQEPRFRDLMVRGGR